MEKFEASEFQPFILSEVLVKRHPFGRQLYF